MNLDAGRCCLALLVAAAASVAASCGGSASSPGTGTGAGEPVGGSGGASSSGGDTSAWSRRFGDGVEQWGHAIAVDASGSAIVTGCFGGTIDFGGPPLESAGHCDIYGDCDMFLAKLDAGGKHVWSKSFVDVGSGRTRGVGVAADGSGSVLATGYFGGTIDFGGAPLKGDGDGNTFLAKLDKDGQHLWSKGFAHEAFSFGRAIAVDPWANVLLMGDFTCISPQLCPRGDR